MKLIGLEEHWCPRELFEKEGTPGHASVAMTKGILTPEQFEASVQSVSDIGGNRLAMMDAVGLDMQVLSLTNAIMEQLPENEAVHYARLSNDILASGLANSKGHLRGFAAIPTGTPEKAVEEMELRARQEGFVGVVVNGHIQGHYLDEPRFEPILEASERLRMPIYIHPALPPKAVTQTYYSIANPYGSRVLASGGWGWHVETGVHVLRLIASGSFDRHPNLQIIVGHLGEGLPFFMQRLENANDPTFERPYSEYLKTNVSYTISGFHDPDLLEFVAKKVGADRIMFSTDYPFNQPEKEIGEFLAAPISDANKELIAHENAERMLHL